MYRFRAHLKPLLRNLLVVVVVLGFWLMPLSRPAQAFVSLSDQFVASRSCPALSAIKSNANPGNIRVSANQVYEVLGKNRVDASYYLIKVTGAAPENRWVAAQCGKLTGNQGIATSGGGSDYLLALSWQPAFCETKPSKTECKSQTQQRFDATHLVLHGLWPQPASKVYCNVSQQIIQLDKDKQWSRLPAINLSMSTRNALAEKMPGIVSNLHLHEWYKHGTCYSSSPEKYFQESIALLDQVNNSSVQNLFANNIGQFLGAPEIRREFDRAFGTGAGNRVMVECKRDIDENQDNMIVELQLNLKGNIQPSTAINRLLLAGKTVPAGCSRGEIDPAGVN
jgi:ribonuclease T2